MSNNLYAQEFKVGYKTFGCVPYLRQMLDKTLFSRCIGVDASFNGEKVASNLGALIEYAGKTIQSDLENAKTSVFTISPKEIDLCAKFVQALNNAKKKLGLTALSNCDKLVEWLKEVHPKGMDTQHINNAVERLIAADKTGISYQLLDSLHECTTQEWQYSYALADAKLSGVMPVDKNGNLLCSVTYLDDLADTIFGDFYFTFNGDTGYFAEQIAKASEQVTTVIAGDLSNHKMSIFRVTMLNKQNVLSLIDVFQNISFTKSGDMIKSTLDYEEKIIGIAVPGFGSFQAITIPLLPPEEALRGHQSVDAYMKSFSGSQLVSGEPVIDQIETYTLGVYITVALLANSREKKVYIVFCLDGTERSRWEYNATKHTKFDAVMNGNFTRLSMRLLKCKLLTDFDVGVYNNEWINPAISVASTIASAVAGAMGQSKYVDWSQTMSDSAEVLSNISDNISFSRQTVFVGDIEISYGVSSQNIAVFDRKTHIRKA